ncbi:MAG: phosphopantetheine-binding protein, partial [Gammaproteobacteria bacterium]|nr:phosphopantetheine-binding protein [Gammaproteobacteria bacterium]
MIPSHYEWLEDLPLTVNGKVDRQKLRLEIELEGANARVYESPRTEEERALVRLWSEVLELPQEQIGIHDNFFELGGNSLTLVKLYNAIQQSLKYKIKIVNLFEYSTIEQFVDFLKNDSQRDLVSLSEATQRGQLRNKSFSQKRRLNRNS